METDERDRQEVINFADVLQLDLHVNKANEVLSAPVLDNFKQINQSNLRDTINHIRKDIKKERTQPRTL